MVNELCILCCSTDYGVEFFKQFSLVLNALDNKSESCHWEQVQLPKSVGPKWPQ